MTPAQALLIVRIALAILLYCFIGWLLVVQWRDLRATDHSVESAPQARLVAIEGMSGGMAFSLDGLNEVGRAADNSIRLDDETVSSHHALVFFHGGQWWLEDLASRNGTDVNELRVEEPLVVAYGDEIRFGRIRLRLEKGE
jgi:pSer/pThr/pTyr-binding forkhead associated (FHA) protein